MSKLRTVPQMGLYTTTIPATANTYYPTRAQPGVGRVAGAANAYLSTGAPLRSVFIAAPSGAAPAPGDALTDAGTFTGDVVSYQADTVGTGGKLVYMPTNVTSSAGAHPIVYEEMTSGQTVVYDASPTFVTKERGLLLPRPVIELMKIVPLVPAITDVGDAIQIEDHEGNNYQIQVGAITTAAIAIIDTIFSKDFPINIQLREGLRFLVTGTTGGWDVLWGVSEWIPGEVPQPV